MSLLHFLPCSLLLCSPGVVFVCVGVASTASGPAYDSSAPLVGLPGAGSSSASWGCLDAGLPCTPQSPTPLQNAPALEFISSAYISKNNSITSLDKFCQSSVDFTVMKYLMMFRWNFLCFSLCLLSLDLGLGTTEKNLSLSSFHPPLRYFYTLMSSLEPYFQAENSQFSHTFLVREIT